MKHIYIYILLLLGCLNLVGQGLPQDFNPRNYIESLVVVTDRDYYTVNETINFKAFNLSPSELREIEWSKVLYIELVGFDGKPLVQSKIKFTSSGGLGQLLVPEGILSGVYYIKAYTKWMRNYGPLSYFYKPLTVLNPKDAAVFLPAKPFDTDFFIEYSALSNQNRIKSDKDLYSLRSTGQLLFSDSTSKTADFSVSITRKSYVHDTIIKMCPIDTSLSFTNSFLPETRGISLSGVLVDKSTQKPISNSKVTVSLKKGNNQTFSTYTNSSGIFNIVLPEVFGTVELLILAENKKQENIEIRLESDFCNRRVLLPYIPLKTGKQDIIRYNEIIINSQIDAQYNPRESLADTAALKELYFYKNPSLRLDIDQFIEMSSLAELFKELVPAVGFKQEKNRTSIHITGPYYYNLDTYEPLVLLDGIIISDIDELLHIDPNDLSAIESYNYPYVLGDITYGGIIKMISREGDMAGYKLPDNGLIYNYKVFDIVSPENIQSEIRSRDPIFRNTLYWNSHFLEFEEKQSCYFNVGDNSGAYSVILHECSDNGELIISKYEFQVGSQR